MINENTGETTLEAAVPLEASTPESNSDQGRQVPLGALESERQKRQHLEEENRMMREHFALLQAQQSLPKQTQSSELDSLKDDDVMTVGEIKKLYSQVRNDMGMELKELKMTQKYPDYQDVVSKYIPEVIKTNPSLRDALAKSQDYELAYYLAKNSDAYKTDNKKVRKNEDAERILKNTQSAGSLSSMGATTPVSQAKRYKDMSSNEFLEIAARNRGY